MSVVMVSGTPKLATHPEIKDLRTVSVDVSGSGIATRQDVRMSVGCWQWSDKVHVDVLKTTSWERETRWGCRGMSMNLALLTRKTFSAPCSDVLVHVWPYEPLANHF